MTHPTPPQPSDNTLSVVAGRIEPTTAEPSEFGQISQLPHASQSEIKHKLILTLDGEVLRELDVGCNNLSIGRKHGNSLQLNDLTLSGLHALITATPDYVFVEDLGSTNGTLVNGNHIKKVALEHGDIIQLGHYQLTYLSETEVKYKSTMFIKAEFDETQMIYMEEADGGRLPKGLRLGGLRVAKGSATKPVMELRKTYNTIGFQGKRMALIARGTEGYTITAVSSTRSRRASDTPLINGKPLTSKQHLLKENDAICISGFKVQFYYLT
ncbi:MAG: FHA domain-containing protein [Gammaproteobacteria bacterium]|nr:FHA domain-containing protein [Gammaproteobacteria bacterium]